MSEEGSARGGGGNAPTDHVHHRHADALFLVDVGDVALVSFLDDDLQARVGASTGDAKWRGEMRKLSSCLGHASAPGCDLGTCLGCARPQLAVSLQGRRGTCMVRSCPNRLALRGKPRSHRTLCTLARQRNPVPVLAPRGASRAVHVASHKPGVRTQRVLLAERLLPTDHADADAATLFALRHRWPPC